MAEERTLGLARAYERDADTEEPSKEALQRRMEQARDSITNTVTEIKENVAQQYESVKEALDWREHFKRQPLAWSLGAAGVGLFVGYGLAAAIKGDSDDDRQAPYSTSYSPAARTQAASAIGETISAAPQLAAKTNGKEAQAKDNGPGMLERFRDTSAYERLSKEAGSLGDRLLEELSTTAQQVVLPALLKKIHTWIGVDLSEKTTSRGNQKQERAPSYEPAIGREF